ncbi:MAG: hypothetical protein CL912_00245 [Deltaproteobacteria bacterium]|nr:hypothetical protein [Deltaproteobacteria bacterium]
MDGEGSSADASCLGSLMLSMMNETHETLQATDVRFWSREAIDFVKATSWATAEELFEVEVLLSGEKSRLTAAVSTHSCQVLGAQKPLSHSVQRVAC